MESFPDEERVAGVDEGGYGSRLVFPEHKEPKMGEARDFPRGQQSLSAFLQDLDEHLDFGPLLVEIGSKYASSQFYLCRTRQEFEEVVRDLGEYDFISVSECSEIEGHCKLLRE